MAKHGVRLALVFLGLIAVVSGGELAGESESKTTETTPYEVALEKSPSVDLPPLTLIRFRHVNRRFPRGPLPLTFLRGRPCRGLDRRREVIPYGGDMILSGGGVGDRRIPIRWTEFRRAEPEFGLPRHHHHDRDDEFDHHHHHHHRHHDHDDHGREHENGFLKGLRKFLGNF